MSAEQNIKAKALKCIDEVYPSADTLNDTYFPVDAFLDEAVRWVIDVVPARILTIREQLTIDDTDVINGAYTAYFTSPIGRVVSVSNTGWRRDAEIIKEDSLLYRQQKNRVLQGNRSKPVAAVRWNETIEIYPTPAPATTTKVYHVPYFPASIPDRAIDLCAWKLAEVVLLSMSDMQNASACTARVTELLQQLSL